MTKTTVFTPIGDVILPIGPTGLDSSASVTVGGNVTGGNVTTGGQVVGATIELDTGAKTATADGNVTATLNKSAGVITTGVLSTAAGNLTTMIITNSKIAAADQVFASISNGNNTTGTPAITTVAPGAGNVTIGIKNIHASAALNGSVLVAFATLKN